VTSFVTIVAIHPHLVKGGGGAPKQAERLKVHAHAVAEQAGRPYEYFESPVRLDRFAYRVNPLLRDELKGYRYYWATHQAEYVTDLLFTSRAALRELYVRLLRHATLCLRAEDVLTFLGRKLHGGQSLLPRCARRRRRSRPGHRALERLVQPVRDPHGRSSRAFNPATVPDLSLFAAVLRGEHALQGFRNREVRTRLFGPAAARRRSPQVSRLVKRLHLREENFPTAFLKVAA
jgi:hypothetical protein